MSLPESIIAGATGHVGHHNSLHELFNDGFAIADAPDVDLADIEDGDGLRWDAAAGQVKRAAPGPINVEDYRQAGDTDTQALDRAIAVLTDGAVLEFGRGVTYSLSARSQISGLDRLTVRGNGATLKPSSVAATWGSSNRYMLQFNDCTNLKISGLYFDGNGAVLTATSGWWLLLGITSTAATIRTTTKTSTNVLVTDCDFVDLRNRGLGVRLVDGVTVRRCTFTQGYQDASNTAELCSIVRCDNVKVIDCDFDGGDNTTATTGGIGTLLCVSPGQGTGTAEFDAASNFLAIMNYQTLSSFTAPAAASATSTATVSYTGAAETDGTPDYITNDWFFYCTDSGSGTGAGIIPSNCMKVTAVDEGAETITVQRCDTSETGAAQNWAGQTIYYDTTKYSRYCQNVNVRGCTFTNSWFAGVFLLGCRYFSITNCRGSACHDIVLDAEFCSEGEISGNSVDNPAGFTGIALLFTCHNVVISGNTVGGASVHGICCFTGYGISSGITITGNILRGCRIVVSANSGATKDSIVEDLEISNNNVRGGPFTGLPGRLATNCLIVGALSAASRDGRFRNVSIRDNSFSDCSQRAVQICRVELCTIQGNTIKNTGYDAIYDDNTFYESSQVSLVSNVFSNIGIRSPSGMGIYKSAAAVTDAPRFGPNVWRNTQTSLNGTQAWYRPANVATIPTGLDHDHVGGLVLRASGGAFQSSPDATTAASGTWTSFSSAGSPADVQIFTASGTWTKPAGAVATAVVCIGGGGAGGSGRRGAAATVRSAGAAGGGGGVTRKLIPASVLGGTETVTVSTGATGGSAISADDTNGNAGGSASATTFGAWVRAAGGSGGAGGSTGAATAGGAGQGMFDGAGAAASSATGAAGSAGAAAREAGGSGASGGGITSGDATSNGAAGGNLPAAVTTGGGGTAGTTPGGAAGNGASATANSGLAGAGGGGGASSISGAAGAGGNGGIYGGGGGGGGASLNATGNSGAGGNGAAGICIAITYL